MPVRQRGRILTVRITKYGERSNPASPAMKVFSEAYEGTLQPSEGGKPIPYKSVFKVLKGDAVSYDGDKRAKNVKPDNLTSTR